MPESARAVWMMIVRLEFIGCYFTSIIRFMELYAPDVRV
jgi:hypothetical protein